MIEVVKLKPEHVVEIQTEHSDAFLRSYFEAGYPEILANLPESYAVLVDGRPVCCAGLSEFWPGRAEAWAMVSRHAGPYFLAIHRRAKAYLEKSPMRRIEASVDASFEVGHRWVRALGFKLEAPHRPGYRVDGGDCALYARVR